MDVLDGDRKAGIAEHPRGNEPGAERLIVVIHGWALAACICFVLRESTCHSLLESRVNVFLSVGSIFDSGCVCAECGLRLERG